MKREHKKKKHTAAALVIGIIAVYLVLLAAGAFFYDARHAELEMYGSSEIRLEYGETFSDPGARAYTTGRLFNGEELEVTVQGGSGISDIGEYVITYSCEYKDEVLSESRTVIVTDTIPPVITLMPDGDFNYTAENGFSEPGYTAYDNHDGDITSKVSVLVGADSVVYTVSDSSGNTAGAERGIIYAPADPVIILTGGSNLEITASVDYRDPGWRAYDSFGNDISSSVVTEVISIDGTEVPEEKRETTEFAPYMPGEYVLRYSIETENGLTAEAERTITVKAAELPKSEAPSVRTIYLTFDDGPGPYTEQLLDTLKKYNVKVTFFVTNQFEGKGADYTDIITREFSEGHSVAIHTYCHDYSTIYAGEEAYLEDFMRMRELIYEKTGYYTNMFRFPGGTSNTVSSFNPGIMSRLSVIMPALGYKYYDWNAESGDAGSYRYKPEKLAEMTTASIEEAMSYYGYAIVLQHDTKDFSVEAVEQIIQWGLARGYVFSALDMTSPRAVHNPNN